MRPFLLWLLALFALSASAASAELPPRPPGPVADIAAILPEAEEAALDAKLRAYNKATGRAIIVATVPSLNGQVVERYAQDLARAWEIGGEESEEGVLVLVAPSERKMRIHAAVGAQGRLTDGVASRIIRETMAPRFKQNDYGGGISAGVDQIIAQLDRDEVDARAVAEAAEAAKSSAGSSDGGGVGVVLFWIVLILFFMLMFGRRRRGYRRSGFGRGVGVWDIGQVAANVAINVALNAALGGDGDGGGGSDSGFGGFGGGGSGFDGGGASGDW
jgi:uncharacterized protein